MERAETKAIRKVKCGAVKERIEIPGHGGEWKAKTRARERFSQSLQRNSTVRVEKQILQERVNSGQYMEGIAIEPKQFECFHVNRTTNEIEQHKATVHARLIPLDEIRERILQRWVLCVYVR